MLDDLKFIHQRDAQDALGVAEKQAGQLRHSFQLDFKPSAITNIVFAGMGGSALSAELSKTWPGYNLPFETCRQYDIPAHVGPETLFIASSYSGNTEETIEALAKAADKKAQIVVIAAGGKLREIAEEKKYPFELLPQVGQPRFAVFASLKALVTILERAGLVAVQSADQELHRAADFVEAEIKNWLPTVATDKNPAKQLAQECMGRSMVIYAGPRLFPAAYKWKIGFNENAKNIAWCNTIPEFNHNEFLGWTSHPVDKPYAVIELRSRLEHERVQKRFEVSERLLSGKRPAPEIVEVRGSTLLEQLLWAVAFGDFVTLYTAMLNNQDPSNIELLEKFKRVMVE